MLISIKYLIDTIELLTKKRFMFYDIGINFAGRKVQITIGSKRNPNRRTTENLDFYNDNYSDPDFVVWKVAEMVNRIVGGR